MESSEEEITWKVIPNTVKSRMKNCSFVHKLIPSRKLRRRNKSMNAKMKRYSALNYSQYVVMKTSVLRDLTDNTDTDDNATFTDDDFTLVYKSDTSLTNYVSQRNRYKYSFVKEHETDNSDLNDEKIPESESQENTNLGWRKIKRKRTNSSSSKDKVKDTSHVEGDRVNRTSDFNILDNDKFSSNEKNVLNEGNSIPIKEKVCKRKSVKLNTKVKSSNVIAPNATRVKINESNSQLNDSNILDNDKFSSNEKNVLTQRNNTIKEKTAELPMKVRSSNVIGSNVIVAKINESNSQLNDSNILDNDKFSSNEENVLTQGNSTSIKEKTVKLSTKVKSSNVIGSNATAAKINESNCQLNDSNILDNDKSSSNEKNVLTQANSTSIKEKTVELYTKVESLNVIPSNATAVEKNETNSQLENYEETETNVNHYNCLETNSNIIQRKNNEVLEVLTLVTCNKNQPKDSGIEEDAEEECLLQSKKHYKKCKSEIQQKKHNITNFTDDMRYSDDLKSESSNVPTTDSEDKTLCGNKDVIRSEESTEEVQKLKLQPKVIHTEIVNKNYKIVLDSPLITRSSETRELNAINSNDEQIYETEELEYDTEDYISNSARKRLQQLRRLNLTTDTDTSSSENDETCSNAENMRSKLFNRTLESSDASVSENDSISFKRKISKVKRNERLSQSDNISLQSDDCSNNENNNLKRYSTIIDRPVLPFKKHKRDTSYPNTSQKLFESTRNSDQEEVIKVPESNLGNETVEQIVNEESVLHRPHDLQEFVENENLQLQLSVPSFRFKDIEEDEIFIVDLPSAVLEQQLLGKRMVLTENKLKLGKRKYRVKYKDIDNLSCIVATGKSRKPYKTVNIKPLKRIIAGERIR